MTRWFGHLDDAHVLEKRAPLAFPYVLRTPLNARETRSPRCAGRYTGCDSAMPHASGFPAPAARGARIHLRAFVPEIPSPTRHQQFGNCFSLGDGLRPAGSCLAAPSESEHFPARAGHARRHRLNASPHAARGASTRCRWANRCAPAACVHRTDALPHPCKGVSVSAVPCQV